MTDKSEGYHATARLLGVISSLRDSAIAGNEDKSLLELIAISNGLSLRNPAVLGVAQAISELPRKIVRQIERLDTAETQYAAPGVNILVEALSPANLGKTWNVISRDIELVGMPSLANCQAIFSGRESERLLDRGELTRLADEANRLLIDVRMNDSLPDATRDFVESALVHLLTAIEQYWVKGVSSIERSIDATVGRAIREGHFVNPDKESRGVLRKLGETLVKIAFVVALANDVDTLPKTVQDVVHGIEHVVDGVSQEKPPVQGNGVVENKRQLPPGVHN